MYGATPRNILIDWWSFGLFNCAFSYASSKDKKFCRSSCIVCRQRVSPRCVKTCDTSDYWTDWKSSCTGYIQRAFLQCVWACACWEQHLACRNSYTAHIWKALLLNEWTCVSWDSQLVRRSSYTVCNWKISLLNGLTCVSWGYQLLCRSNCIACTQKVSRRFAKTCYTSLYFVTRRPILLHGVSNLWSLSFSLFQSFSLRPSENTFISAPQGPGDKATPKRHHPKTFWSSRDSLINHLTPLCACTHTYPCVLGPLHSPLTLEFNFFNWYNHPVS